MRDVGGKTVGVLDDRRKKRRDCDVADDGLIRRTRERLARRVIPEIRRAFQFDATRIERYIVARYSAEDGGHFAAIGTTPPSARRAGGSPSPSTSMPGSSRAGTCGFPSSAA